MTQQEPMRKMPFYSVDSTSWLSGARFGTTYEFRNGQLKVHSKKDVRKRFKRECEKFKIDYDGLLADSGKAINEWNMIQWKQYADWLTQSPMKKKQEYWHDRVNGGEFVKKVNVDFETWEREMIILNGKGEEHDEEEYQEQLEEIEQEKEEQLALIEGNTDLTPREETMKHKLAIGQFMECDSCTLGDRCPMYFEGAMCRLPVQEVQGAKDFAEVMKFLFNLQQKRLMLGAMQESQDGGILDERLSKEMDRMMNLMQRFRDLTNPQDSVEIKAKGSASGGILQQIFGIKNND